jgi:Tol biopolymer transport system component
LDVECASLFIPCGTPIILTQQPEVNTEPAWSPDGTGLAFVNERYDAPEIYWMPAAGGTAYNLTLNSATDSFPIWSPDGHYMAFYSDRTGFLEVYVMNMDCLHDIASCPTAIHHLGGGFNSLPAWSPMASS